MILAISGWRYWKKSELIQEVLDNITLAYRGEPTGRLTIRVGDCPTGVDKYVADYCQRNGENWELYRADWPKEGKLAGPLRNWNMLNGVGYTSKMAQLLLAFPEPERYPQPGSGTWNCVGTAADLGIPTMLYPSYVLVSPPTFALAMVPIVPREGKE